MINLSNAEVIGEGHERTCYQHPLDALKVIKVPREGVRFRNQNGIDLIYYKYLKKSGKDLSLIPVCYGFENTNIGIGLVTEKIVNDDNTPVVSMLDIIRNSMLELSEIDGMLSRLISYLKSNNIIFADVGLSNVLCRKKKSGGYDIFIVDGLGSRHLDFKFKVYMRIGLAAAYKVRKQINKLLSDYNRTVKKTYNAPQI